MSHITLDNQNIRVGNIFCIARSYAADADGLARAREAGVQPVVFLKPTSALHFAETVALPAQSAHIVYESELVVLIGQGGKTSIRGKRWPASPAMASGWISRRATGRKQLRLRACRGRWPKALTARPA